MSEGEEYTYIISTRLNPKFPKKLLKKYQGLIKREWEAEVLKEYIGTEFKQVKNRKGVKTYEGKKRLEDKAVRVSGIPDNISEFFEISSVLGSELSDYLIKNCSKEEIESLNNSIKRELKCAIENCEIIQECIEGRYVYLSLNCSA
jgi:hypothetical protein